MSFLKALISFAFILVCWPMEPLRAVPASIPVDWFELDDKQPMPEVIRWPLDNAKPQVVPFSRRRQGETARFLLRFHSVPPSAQGLFVPRIFCAYRIYAQYGEQGSLQLVAQNGVYGGNQAQTTPNVQARIYRLPEVVHADGVVYLVIEISSFYHDRLGVRGRVQLGQYEDLVQRRNQTQAIYKIVCGMIIMMGIYNLIRWSDSRYQSPTLWLGIFCLITGIRILSINDLLEQFLPGQSLFYLKFFIEYISMCAGALFCFYIFALFPRCTPRWIRYVTATVGISFTILTFASPVRQFSAFLIFYQISAVFCLFLTVYVLMRATVQRQPGALYAVAGIIVFSATVIFDIYTINQGAGQGTTYSIASLLFFYLEARAETEQNRAVERALVVEQTSNQHLLTEMKKLIYEHQAFQIRQGHKLETTMPCTRAFACILNFDIQHSSDLGLDLSHEFFREALQACHNLVMDSYDSESGQSKAYMIKEMGDGFLCSVGFPFATDQAICERALDLAHRFIEAFQSTVEKFFGGKSVFCSIGMAYGEVTGYFPKVGLKQYDLHGDAIVMATRYEQFRKQLLAETSASGHVIILQEAVTAKLPIATQKALFRYEIRERRVRDDPKARFLYYQIIKPKTPSLQSA